MLFKSINACCYINRLIRDGLKEEFNLEIKNIEAPAKKEFTDAEC
jgi:hypothetical protein